MFGFVDATKKPLTIPPRFVPYMEKHRIYELFLELAKLLVIKKPDDHVVYMKQCLPVAARNRDAPRIVLIAPRDFDKMALAEVLQNELDVQPLTLNDLRTVSPTGHKICPCNESESLALNMREILRSGKLLQTGWILVDIPRTKKEAHAFQRLGVIPTHAIEIKRSNILGYINGADTVTTFHPPLYSWKTHFDDPEYKEDAKNIRGLREAYADVLIEVEDGIRSMFDLGKDIAKLTSVRKHSGAPCLFRIILIGCRGSGHRTIAEYLSQRFNLVHVDFNYVLEQARLQENELGDALRLFECRWGCRPKPETRIRIVERCVLSEDCLRRGWVLTGYPINVDDFKHLDMIATPPNRVIFLDVYAKTCRERILNRRYSVATGSKHDLMDETLGNRNDYELRMHPRDHKSVLEQDIQEYEENLGDMMQYAEESAFVVDGNADELTVRERVEACLIRPAKAAKPRMPSSVPKIDPMNVEFDPDDEPDHHIFDEIREPEPQYTFI